MRDGGAMRLYPAIRLFLAIVYREVEPRYRNRNQLKLFSVASVGSSEAGVRISV